MKQLVIFPKGSLTSKDKERMSKEGYLAIETDEPSKVIMPMPSGELFTGNDLLVSALDAMTNYGITGGGTIRAQTLASLTTKIVAKETKK